MILESIGIWLWKFVNFFFNAISVVAKNFVEVVLAILEIVCELFDN